MAIERRFKTTDGIDVTRLALHETEATSAQAAGADGGRTSSVQRLQFVTPGFSNSQLVAISNDSNASTYCVVQASLTSSSGPWTDISSGALSVSASAGTTVDVWLRLLTKRWNPSLVNPRIHWDIRLRAKGNANFTG